jgi:hypothetical protein
VAKLRQKNNHLVGKAKAAEAASGVLAGRVSELESRVAALDSQLEDAAAALESVAVQRQGLEAQLAGQGAAQAAHEAGAAELRQRLEAAEKARVELETQVGHSCCCCCCCCCCTPTRAWPRCSGCQAPVITLHPPHAPRTPTSPRCRR